MDTRRVYPSAQAFSARLRQLQQRRKISRGTKVNTRGPRRALTPAQRAEVLAKTGGRCHICGGRIKRGSRWAADHILAYAQGGPHDVSNYLPAHGPCNGYRRHFGAEEFQWILKLGVWFRTQIARRHPRAMEFADYYVRHEQRRDRRRVVAGG
jgi:hypothetical protein